MLDHYGNPLTTASSTARDHYDEGVRHLLGSNYGALEAMQAAIDADPQFALAHVGLARAQMTAGDMSAARATLEKAQGLATGTSDREQQHIKANVLMANGQGPKARQVVERHVLDHPRDVLVAQMCTSVFGLIAFSGCAATEPQILAYTSALLPHYENDWWIKSAHAVSLCETGQPDRALDLMEESLELHPRNANGAHFKSHALYEMGQTEAGLDYLKHWLEAYDARAVLHGHLNWHVALWALADGDEQTMWSRVDDYVVPGSCQGLPINILTDTASILLRAQLAGVTVDPQRWQTVSAYAAQYFPNCGQSFVDMHSALSHAMAGETERLDKYISASKGFAADLVAPLAKAWQAIVREDWAGALNQLVGVMENTSRLGGSRAQRDMLEFTYVSVLLKLGQRDEAARAIRQRRAAQSVQLPVAGYS